MGLVFSISNFFINKIYHAKNTDEVLAAVIQLYLAEGLRYPWVLKIWLFSRNKGIEYKKISEIFAYVYVVSFSQPHVPNLILF